mmetsp:Transcript_12941/g.16628  ORF Transcript_12941/g.16628 Transcript_12941/m.16628 type:complete len:292 (+) Transcript_12941:128-1003(+)
MMDGWKNLKVLVVVATFFSVSLVHLISYGFTTASFNEFINEKIVVLKHHHELSHRQLSGADAGHQVFLQGFYSKRGGARYRGTGGGYSSGSGNGEDLSSYTVEYKGCFQDDSDEDLMQSQDEDDGLFDVESCMKECKYYDYMGLQDNGAMCFCDYSYGNPSDQYPQLNNTECGDKCYEGTEECLGGPFTNAIYAIDSGFDGDTSDLIQLVLLVVLIPVGICCLMCCIKVFLTAYVKKVHPEWASWRSWKSRNSSSSDHTEVEAYHAHSMEMNTQAIYPQPPQDDGHHTNKV